MKKSMTLEFDKCPRKDSDRSQRLKDIAGGFIKPYKELGEFIVQRIFTGKVTPKRLKIHMEIWRGIPTKRGVKVIIGTHTLDNLKKCDRCRVILRMFTSAFGAIGHYCADNIRQRKRLPEKVVIEVEVR